MSNSVLLGIYVLSIVGTFASFWAHDSLMDWLIKQSRELLDEGKLNEPLVQLDARPFARASKRKRLAQVGRMITDLPSPIQKAYWRCLAYRRTSIVLLVLTFVFPFIAYRVAR